MKKKLFVKTTESHAFIYFLGFLYRTGALNKRPKKLSLHKRNKSPKTLLLEVLNFHLKKVENQ